MKQIALGLALVLIALNGCVESEDELGEDELADLEQSLDNVQVANNGYGPGVHVVAPANHICFISGVRGRMIGTGFELLRGPNWWTIAVGQNITAVNTVCYGPVAGRPTEIYEWRAGDPPTPMGSYTATKRCFLTGYGTLGAMNSAGDNVRAYTIYRDWFLGGAGDDNTAKATALCATFSSVVSTTTLLAPPEGHVSQFVASAADNAICGLSQIGGDWTRNPIGVSEARLHYSATYGWSLSVDDGRKVTAVCVR